MKPENDLSAFVPLIDTLNAGAKNMLFSDISSSFQTITVNAVLTDPNTNQIASIGSDLNSTLNINFDYDRILDTVHNMSELSFQLLYGALANLHQDLSQALNEFANGDDARLLSNLNHNIEYELGRVRDADGQFSAIFSDILAITSVLFENIPQSVGGDLFSIPANGLDSLPLPRGEIVGLFTQLLANLSEFTDLFMLDRYMTEMEPGLRAESFRDSMFNLNHRIELLEAEADIEMGRTNFEYERNIAVADSDPERIRELTEARNTRLDVIINNLEDTANTLRDNYRELAFDRSVAIHDRDQGRLTDLINRLGDLMRRYVP
jgi:hypothetical protein